MELWDTFLQRSSLIDRQFEGSLQTKSPMGWVRFRGHMYLSYWVWKGFFNNGNIVLHEILLPSLEQEGGEAWAENPRLLSVLCGARVSQINKSHQIPFQFCSQLRELSILSDLDHLLLQHESRARAVLRTDVFLGTFQKWDIETDLVLDRYFLL